MAAAGIEVKTDDTVQTRVDGIARRNRFGVRKEPPSTASDYVALLTMPLEEALDPTGCGQHSLREAPASLRARVLTEVLGQVGAQLHTAIGAMLAEARQTHQVLARRGGAGGAVLGRLAIIEAQAKLDAEGFVAVARGLLRSSVPGGDGAAAAACPSLETLAEAAGRNFVSQITGK